jgi:hypothetical protein
LEIIASLALHVFWAKDGSGRCGFTKTGETVLQMAHILGMSSSQLTNIFFQRRRYTNNQLYFLNQ